MKPSRAYHDFTSYHREPGGLRRLDFFVDRLQTRRGERKEFSVLDIGCGNGNIALPLASLGFQVTGVDLDGASIARAQERAKELGLQVDFKQGDLTQIVGQHFDAIIASEVLEHQTETSEFLKQLKAACAADGILLLSVPNGKSVEERIRKITTLTRLGREAKQWLKRHIRRFDVQSMADSPHVKYFSWRELENELFAAGWVIQMAKPAAAWFKEFFALCGRFTMKRGSVAFHKMDAGDAWLAERLPIWGADGWLLEATSQDRSRPLVLQVVPSLAGGGAEKLVFELTKRLPDFGYAAKTIAVLKGGPTEALFQKSDTPYTIVGRRGLFGWRALLELRRIMRRERPEVVNTHLFGADAWGRVAAWLCGVPVRVSTEHNVNLDHGWIKTSIKTALAPLTQGFIAVSATVKEWMQTHDRIPAKKIHVILNGIDLSKVKQRPAGTFHDVPRLITVGRLMPQKNQAALLKALALIQEPWKLQIVGTGPLEDGLRQLAVRLGIEARVQFLGYRTDVPELLAESDVFCFPSRWEGLGLALLEAAAAGLPIVATDLPVFRELLSDDEAAYIPNLDVPALARGITQILHEPGAAVVRAQAAREKIKREFSIERMVERYAEYYSTLRREKSR